MSWNLGVSLVFAIPCAIAADRIIERRSTVASLTGRLFVDDLGRLDGYCLETAAPIQGWAQSRPWADFKIVVSEVAWGWPSASRSDPDFVGLNLTRFDDGQPDLRDLAALRQVVARSSRNREAAVRTAIDARLQLGTQRSPVPTLRWGHLAFNALIFWPCVNAAVAAFIGIAWVIAALNEQRVKAIRKSLRAKGLCPRCKHYVDGNLWSARCPECGEPLY